MEAKYLFLSFIGFVCGDGLHYGGDVPGTVVNEQVEYVEVEPYNYVYEDEEVLIDDIEPERVLTEKAADLTMFGETTGCGVNRDCLSCANDRHKGCTWYGNVGCVRARKPFQCTANPFVPGEVKEQCIAFQDCKSCTTQAGCVFYKGSCTYSAGTNCLEDPLCINYPGQCPMVPLAVEARIFNGGEYNPIIPPVHSLGHPGPVVYQDISVMADPYKNPLERQKRFHEDRWANPSPPFGGYPRPQMSYPLHHSSRTYTPSVGRPTVMRSTPNVVHQFTPAGAIPSFRPTSRVFGGISRGHSFGSRSRSFGGRVGGAPRGHYNRGHNRFGGGHHYGWN